MRKIYSVSENIATHTAEYSKKNRMTQSAIVETALTLYFNNFAKSPIKETDRPKRGRPFGTTKTTR